MSKHASPLRLAWLWWLLGVALVARLASMALLPLMDTSEPRYAETARIMAETGDWITPYFHYGVPFWGKPPLSFWSQALSFKLLGVNEFAVRLPSLLATLGILGLIFSAARALAGRAAAWLAVTIYATSALGFVAAGAVLTDPFLTFATTLTLVSALRLGVDPQPSRWWGYLLFAGLGLGLLAKGPLMVALVVIPLGCWLYLAPPQRERRIPWLGGAALALAIGLPWYVLAELKTPGFLNYFIVGEHLLRFLDSGWQGDLYGSAHEAPYGTIWWYALQATFPWGLVAGWLLVSRAVSSWRSHPAQPEGVAQRAQFSDWQGLLWAASLWPLCFFTFAGNILWTYVQPALPSFAILLALALMKAHQRNACQRRPLWGIAAAVVPVVLTVLGANMLLAPHKARTEKHLVQFARQYGGAATTLAYLDVLPFSARHYSSGKAQSVDRDQLASVAAQPGYLLAIRKEHVGAIPAPVAAQLRQVFSNHRYALFSTGITADSAPRQTVRAGGFRRVAWHGASFDTHVQEARRTIRAERTFQSARIEDELGWNAPYELRPQTPGSRAVLLVHGLGDSPWSFVDVAHSLAAQGYVVRTALLAGHGTRPDAMIGVRLEDWQRQVREQIALLRAEFDDVYLGGFSTGANLVLEYAIDDPDIRGLLLFSPALRSSVTLDWTTPFLARWKTWLFPPSAERPQQSALRYHNVPLNGFAQFYRSSVAVRRAIDGKDFDRPVLVVLAQNDSVVDVDYMRTLFERRFTHPASRLIWYGEDKREPSSRVLVLPDYLPQERISQFSHMGVLFSPDNPLYGRHGSMPLCRNGQSAVDTAVCEAGGLTWYSDWGYREAGKVHARLTFNPYFEWQAAVMHAVLAGDAGETGKPALQRERPVVVSAGSTVNAFSKATAPAGL
ncbi:MAG: alpha/beta fold hydrolase [Duganella sp.]